MEYERNTWLMENKAGKKRETKRQRNKIVNKEQNGISNNFLLNVNRQTRAVTLLNWYLLSGAPGAVWWDTIQG